MQREEDRNHFMNCLALVLRLLKTKNKQYQIRLQMWNLLKSSSLWVVLGNPGWGVRGEGWLNTKLNWSTSISWSWTSQVSAARQNWNSWGSFSRTSPVVNPNQRQGEDITNTTQTIHHPPSNIFLQSITSTPVSDDICISIPKKIVFPLLNTAAQFCMNLFDPWGGERLIVFYDNGLPRLKEQKVQWLLHFFLYCKQQNTIQGRPELVIFHFFLLSATFAANSWSCSSSLTMKLLIPDSFPPKGSKLLWKYWLHIRLTSTFQNWNRSNADDLTRFQYQSAKSQSWNGFSPCTPHCCLCV